MGGADGRLPTLLQEFGVLKESAAVATRRVKALEEFNEQVECRISQLQTDIVVLRKGTVDLKSEGELMQEVMQQQ